MIDEKIKKSVFEEIEKSKEDAELNATKIEYFLNHNEKYYQLTCDLNELTRKMAYNSYKGLDFSKLKKEYDTKLKQRQKVLENLGYSLSDMKPNYSCKKCNDMGIVDGGYCDCFLKKYNEKLMKHSGVDFNNTPLFKDYSLEVFSENKKEMEKVLNISKVFVENFDNLKIKNLIFFGGTGLGKTFLAKVIAKELINRSHTVLFTTAFGLNQAFVSEHYNNRFSTSNSLQSYLDAELLIIDDFGTQSAVKNVSAEYMLNLIEERSMKNKSTIITTNLSVAGIESAYGTRLASRLADPKLFMPLEFVGKDLRLKR